MLVYIIIFVAIVFNAAMDSIDHSKRSRGVFEVWHILKQIFLGLFIIPLLYFSGNLTWWSILSVILLVYIVFEGAYQLFLKLELYKLDDKYRIQWIQKLLYPEHPVKNEEIFENGEI